MSYRDQTDKQQVCNYKLANLFVYLSSLILTVDTHTGLALSVAWHNSTNEESTSYFMVYRVIIFAYYKHIASFIV